MIDAICSMIREQCQEQELVRVIKMYQIEEAKQITQEAQGQKVITPDEIKLDLNMLGQD